MFKMFKSIPWGKWETKTMWIAQETKSLTRANRMKTIENVINLLNR